MGSEHRLVKHWPLDFKILETIYIYIGPKSVEKKIYKQFFFVTKIYKQLINCLISPKISEPVPFLCL